MKEQTFYCVVGTFESCHVAEVYRITTSDPELIEDIEFMAGKTVHRDQNEDKAEQARVDRIWDDVFSDRVSCLTSDANRGLDIKAGRMIGFDYWNGDTEPSAAEANSATLKGKR